MVIPRYLAFVANGEEKDLPRSLCEKCIAIHNLEVEMVIYLHILLNFRFITVVG